ncbi:hypothetical protein VTI28DRAFT_7693 [Corynascus sepedonium]
MPYDSGWAPEKVYGYNANTFDAEIDHKNRSPERVSTRMKIVEEQNQQSHKPGGYEEVQDNVKSENLVELNRHGSAEFRSSQQIRHTIPKDWLPFPGAEAIARFPDAEAVFHSRARPLSLKAPGEGMASRSGVVINLVTSDDIPDTGIQQEESRVKTLVVPPPKPQPPTAPAPLPMVTPQPNNRGRPAGWRRGHGSYAAMRAGLRPGSSTPLSTSKKPPSEQKITRRPRKKSTSTARQIYLTLNPHFISFRCEWENCPAELQNVDTLRKHLLVVHGRPSAASSTTATSSQPLPCKWSNCTTAPLPSHDSFSAHIEKAHLLPYLWHTGDGPRNSTPSPRFCTLAVPTREPRTTMTEHPIPKYLLDPHSGEQVTPSVAGQRVEGKDERRRRQARLNRVLAQRDQNAPAEPEYSPRELEVIAEALAAKQARQEMFREYAERVCGDGAEMDGWKP